VDRRRFLSGSAAAVALAGLPQSPFAAILGNFEFALHPMERTVIAGDLAFPLEQARQVLNVFAAFAATAPDELCIDGGMVSQPGGFSGVGLGVCYSGDPQLADRLLAPLRKAGTLVHDSVRPMDYVAVQKPGDISDPRARGTYLKSGFVSALTPKMVDILVDGFKPHPGRNMFVGFQHGGGAVGRVADDAPAFAHRYAAFDTLFVANWKTGTDPAAHIEYVRHYFSTDEPYTEGFYTNDVALDDTQQKINRNYRGNYERLVGLKTKYDPTNLFRLNANIPPRAA
jgi:hypothetical protein